MKRGFHYVFTSSLESSDIDRDSEERRLAPKFQHVCLVVCSNYDERTSLINTWLLLVLFGSLHKAQKRIRTKKKGDTFWDKEMEEFEMEENENLVIGRGRGISVVNRTRVRKDDGK